MGIHIKLADPHDFETSDDIVSEIRKDKKPYALKVAKELEKFSFGDRVLMDDAATCLRDDSNYKNASGRATMLQRMGESEQKSFDPMASK